MIVKCEGVNLNKKHMLIKIITLGLIYFILCSTASANIFNNSDFENYGWPVPEWTSFGDYIELGGSRAHDGSYGCGLWVPGDIGENDAYISQTVTLSNNGTLSYWIKRGSVLTGNDNYFEVIIGTDTYRAYTNGGAFDWVQKEIDVSEYDGEYLVKFWGHAGSDDTVMIYIDTIEVTEQTAYNLYGYVTNNLGNPVGSANIVLNNSGGETTSNDTGYYEITGISSGIYTITATSPTHEDYSDTVSISGNTEKNITMTRLSPVLTYTDSDTTVTDVFLFWKRNNVVDNVRIYKDTETRLLTTVGNGAYLSGMYSDKNLECNKGYVYWLQPMDGSVAGPKYRIDAKTDPCTDGGSGGTVPDPTPDLTPVVTPGPTVPPEINMTQEEWLNLTLEEKQDVLTNITLMAPVDGLFSPLLEFKWEDVLVWGIHLFLILCAVLALDSITTQKMSEYTGLIAIIPGGMFAYLGGYLVI